MGAGKCAVWLRIVMMCAGFTVACDNAEAPGKATTRLACDAFAAMNATPATFEAFSAGPGPVLKTQPTPFDVTLAATVAPGQYSGHAQWQIDVPGLYGIYVDQVATFVVRDATKSLVTFKHQLGSPVACDRIGRYGFVNLATGVYSLEVGPTPFPAVRLQLVNTVAGDNL